jgi:hypothetical protein
MTDSLASASGEAFAQLAAFLSAGRLTGVVGDLERDLAGADAPAVRSAVNVAGFVPDLLTAAFLVRRDLGRLNDLIHATAICLALPTILEPDERLTNRPSLAAGNDATRTFDVETDRRIAEFKLALWSSTNAMRKRGVFHDLVHLAADTSGRQPELYVVGEEPLRFLRGSRSHASWGLNRGAESTRALFMARFGPLDMPIREFTNGPAAHVRLVNLADVLPQVRDALDAR